MCNLSQGIEDKATIKIILKMNENNLTIEQISLATEKSAKEIEKIIKKYEVLMIS